MGTSQQPLTPAPDSPGQYVCELARHGTRWGVYLEVRAHSESGGRPHHVTGRLHFLGDGRRRSSTWIFVEWSAQDVLDRLGQFSPAELGRLMDGLREAADRP